MSNDAMYYGSYLQLDKIINSQFPVSFNEGNEPAHDEMLFIIIHQAYELWFKQILFELNYVQQVLGKDKINDNSEELNVAKNRLGRVHKIMQLLNQQIELLDSMTPLDFLEFRNLLTPSSGFQSVQFRLIEATLGLTLDKRHHADYYKRTNEGGFNPHDYQTINQLEAKPNIAQCVNKWLERMPFFNDELWQDVVVDDDAANQSITKQPFWQQYRSKYAQSLTEREQGKLADFDYVFFNTMAEGANADAQVGLRQMFSAEALRAALFIMLYRDYPIFQISYQILDTLIEIDHAMSIWRHKHLVMVRRMIGLRVGTGNTSGSGYLEGALSKHYIYRELSGLSTYLIERKKIPTLPKQVVQRLGFSY